MDGRRESFAFANYYMSFNFLWADEIVGLASYFVRGRLVRWLAAADGQRMGSQHTATEGLDSGAVASQSIKDLKS